MFAARPDARRWFYQEYPSVRFGTRRVEGDSFIRPAVGFFYSSSPAPEHALGTDGITVSSRSATARATKPGPNKGLAAGVVRGRRQVEPGHVSEFVYRATPYFRDSGRNQWLDRVHSAGVGLPSPAASTAGVAATTSGGGHPESLPTITTWWCWFL
jgi:hypothetical protein